LSVIFLLGCSPRSQGWPRKWRVEVEAAHLLNNFKYFK